MGLRYSWVLERYSHTALDSFLVPAIDREALVFPCDGCVVLDFMQWRSTLSNPVFRIDVCAKPPDGKGVCR